MKKEWWIGVGVLGVLGVLVIVLLLMLITNKSVNNNNNNNNQSLNNSNVNPVVINNGNNNCVFLENSINTELGKAQKCSSDSECVIEDDNMLDIPCFILCETPYNKNYDITKLKSLNRNYKNNNCEQDCSKPYCESITGVKCVNNKCEIIYVKTTNGQAPVCGNGICEKDKNETAVPGEYIPGVHDESYYNGHYICGRDCGANA